MLIIFGESLVFISGDRELTLGLGSCFGSYREWGPGFAKSSQQKPENPK
jgi:hypothetical protein